MSSTWFQGWIQQKLGRYIDPILEENRTQREMLESLHQQLIEAQDRLNQQESRFQGIADHEQWTRDRFDQQESRFQGIADHEQWTRDRFDQQESRFQGIADHEQWTRDRFDQQESRFQGIADHEQWTRDRFDQQESRFQGIADHEQWTRDRFDQQESRFRGIADHEQWTRDRFEEQDLRFEGIAQREEWTRKRFEEQDRKFSSMEHSSPEAGGQLSFSQSGEDMIVSYLLHFLQKPMSEVTYLDLGANHAKELSNTYSFYLMGAKGVLLEANPELIPELETIRPHDIVLNRVISFESHLEEMDFYVLSGDGLSTIDYEEALAVCQKNPELSIKAKYSVPTIKISQLLEEYFSEELTILSIDLEGIEEHILSQIDFQRYHPWIIILENIPYRPTLSIDEREYKGCATLGEYGYTEYAFTGINSIFLRRDIVEQFNEKRSKELWGTDHDEPRKDSL